MVLWAGQEKALGAHHQQFPKWNWMEPKDLNKWVLWTNQELMTVALLEPPASLDWPIILEAS